MPKSAPVHPTPYRTKECGIATNEYDDEAGVPIHLRQAAQRDF